MKKVKNNLNKMPYKKIVPAETSGDLLNPLKNYYSLL